MERNWVERDFIIFSFRNFVTVKYISWGSTEFPAHLQEQSGIRIRLNGLILLVVWNQEEFQRSLWVDGLHTCIGNLKRYEWMMAMDNFCFIENLKYLTIMIISFLIVHVNTTPSLFDQMQTNGVDSESSSKQSFRNWKTRSIKLKGITLFPMILWKNIATQKGFLFFWHTKCV